MENTQVEEISPIETALAKENITNQVIEKLKADYSGLKINGIDDKAGFKAVEDARKHCKQLRVLAVNICKSGREDALKTQKDWIAKEKEIVAEERAKAKAIQDEQDAIIAANKKKADEEAAKAKAIADLKIQQEREAKEKAEAELKAAKEAEEKRFREIEEAKELELTKGDAAKVADLINDLNALKTKYSFKSKKHQTVYLSVGELLDKTITYITSKK